MRVIYIGKNGCVKEAFCQLLSSLENISLSLLDPVSILTSESTANADYAEVIIVDISNLTINYREFLEKLKILFPSVPILVLHYYNDPILIREFLLAGAAGYLPLNASASEIEVTLRKISGTVN